MIIIFYLYCAGMAMVGLFSFFNIYHLVRFAPRTGFTALVIGTYLIVLFAIVSLTLALLLRSDWTASLPLVPAGGIEDLNLPTQ